MFQIQNESTRSPLLLLVLALTFLGLASDARADLIGLPQITFDSRQGPGQDLFTTQGVHFTGGTGWAVSAKALSITFDGVNFMPLVNGTVDLQGRFIDSFVSGGLVIGNLTSIDGVNADLIVADNTGLLLAAVYGAREIPGVIGTGDGTSQSTFTVIGGSLAPFYAQSQGQGMMVNTLFNITPLFNPNSFANNFDGQIDGRFGPVVPEPSTLTLLGIGTLSLLGYGWRRRKKAVA